MKLGASTIPHRQQPLTRSLLETYRAAGIESLELCDYHPNFDYDDDSFRTFVGGALRELEFHLNSIHIHLRHRDPACDLASIDVAQRERSVAEHKKTVNFAADLGGCILVTHDIDIPEPDDPESSSRRAAFVDGVRAVADYAEAKGVRLALENLSSGYTREPDRLVALMGELDSTNVGVVIDTGHRSLSGDPAAALRTVGRHLITLHLHDNHGERDEHLLPGQGAIDWVDVMQALRDIDYGGEFMYEIGRPEDLPELAENAKCIQRE
jgi:sugar phosphate isomerase/epimerase